MDFTIITIIALLLLGVVAALIHKATTKKGEPDEIVMPAAGNCATCNGEDERCEQECMMEAATKEIEYYNDEELDRYKKVIESTAHLIMEFSQKGGFSNATNL